jgi:hypothetical protein
MRGIWRDSTAQKTLTNVGNPEQEKAKEKNGNSEDDV